MRRILFSLIIVLLSTVVVAGATKSYFADAAEVTGVTFSSGNADLQLTQVNMQQWYSGNATSADLAVNFPQKIYPGYQGSWNKPDGVIYLGNFSTAPINLVVNGSLTNYSETSPNGGNVGNTVQLAMAWGGTCDPNGVGTGFHPLNWWRTNSVTLFTGSTSGCGYIPNDHSNGYGGYARSLAFYLYVPPTAGNEIAGANASFNIHFNAVQQP